VRELASIGCPNIIGLPFSVYGDRASEIEIELRRRERYREGEGKNDSARVLAAGVRGGSGFSRSA